MILLRYLCHMMLVIPCLPVLLLQARRMKKNIPQLPEASGPDGLVQLDGLRTLRLLVLGESTVAGIGVENHQDGLPGEIARTLSEQLNVTVSWRTYGRSGYRMRRIIEETVPEMENEKVELITIALGGNDAFEMNTPWGWRKDCIDLIDALSDKFPEAKIAFMHLPPIRLFSAFTGGMKWALGNLVEIFGEVLADEIKNHPNAYFHHQIVTLESWRNQTGKELPAEAFFSDGVHPSRLNYELWGKDFGTWVVNERILEGNTQ